MIGRPAARATYEPPGLRMNAAQFPTYGQDSDSLHGAATSETRLAPRNSRFVEALRVMIFMHM